MAADFTDHAVAPGFFTIAAASGVLGSAALLVMGWFSLGWGLWWACTIFAVGLLYGIFTALITHRNKPSLQKGLNGSWLVAVVACQAVSVLAGLLVPEAGEWKNALIFVALEAWLFGGMLYLWIIALIFYRYLFNEFEPADLSPPYWINMGAVAISTLAGCGLISVAHEMPLLTLMKPFLLGLTLFFWATATWWIPMLLTLGFWCHVVKRLPIKYDPSFWGAVFPLGMYSLAGEKLSVIYDQPMVAWMAAGFWWIALGAWCATFLGMGTTLLRTRKG